MVSIILQAIENDSDREFIISLYSKYNGMIRGKVMKRFGDKHDAEDVVQNTLLKLIKNIDKLKDLNEAQLISYISAIVKNTCTDFYNKNGKKSENDINYELVENELSVKDFSAKEKLEFLLIKQLDKKSAMLLYEKYVNRATIEEISSRYNIRPGTVATLIRRGKDTLRKYLGEVE